MVVVVLDWVSARSQAWLAREWLQIPSWLSCQSLTRFFAHRSHYSAIPACKPYYVLHGISALEVAVVVLYLSRYQHHDENLAGKLSQSWSEKSSGSTRKRMDAFKSLWSVALAWVDIGLNFDAVLLCATTQEEEVKCCKIEREKKASW